jgi:hypothetical protein
MYGHRVKRPVADDVRRNLQLILSFSETRAEALVSFFYLALTVTRGCGNNLSSPMQLMLAMDVQLSHCGPHTTNETWEEGSA